MPRTALFGMGSQVPLRILVKGIGSLKAELAAAPSIACGVSKKKSRPQIDLNYIRIEPNISAMGIALKVALRDERDLNAAQAACREPTGNNLNLRHQIVRRFDRSIKAGNLGCSINGQRDTTRAAIQVGDEPVQPVNTVPVLKAVRVHKGHVLTCSGQWSKPLGPHMGQGITGGNSTFAQCLRELE